MSRKHFIAFMPAAVIVCLSLCATAAAAEIVLNPIADIWLREYKPDSVYDADFVSVWAPNTSPNEDGNNARHGVLSFDLSTITKPIASARLELYMVASAWNTRYPGKQAAYLVTPVVTDDSTLSWNSYYGANPVETQLEGLGVYNLPADNPVKQFYASSATAADVAVLESMRTGGSTATFVFKAQTIEEEVTEVEGRHDWGDMVTPAEAPYITVNGTNIYANVDTWVRESANGSVYENDDISVWHSEHAGAGQRVGILEFDLSSIEAEEEITSASMSLFSLNSSTTGEIFVQNAKLLDAQSAPLNWNDYIALSGTTLEGIGHYNLAADAPVGAYIESDAASEADLALLDTARQAGGKLIISLESVPQEVTHTVYTPTSRDWADTESTWAGYGDVPANQPEIWPRLIIEEVPEPNTFVLLALGVVTLLAIRRRV